MLRHGASVADVIGRSAHENDRRPRGRPMRRLVALDLPGGQDFVIALRSAWDAGDAVFPVDQRLPPAGKAALIGAMAPALVVEPAGSSSRPGARPVEQGDALVVATSGSTGTPKGVVLTHDAVAASAQATSRRLSATTADTWLACLPLAHVGGLSVVTRALHTGTGLVVLPGFDTAAVEQAASEGATLVSLVATALLRIDAGRFRSIVVGGSRPPDDPPANVVTTYGLTETGSGVVYDGRPLDDVEIDIAADGEIRLRGPMLLRALRDGSDPKDVDGWLPTGDLGGFGADGRLVVDGRRAELIITGGENVWPEPVERLLAGVTGVADVAVVGVPDPEWGQRVVAVVVPTSDGPPSLDALRSHVRATMPAFCAPKELMLRAAIPRTALGKVRRQELAGEVIGSSGAP